MRSRVPAVGSVTATSWERADVVGQGLAGPTVSADGAAILRNSNSVTAKVVMATPESGGYAYPTGPTGSGIAGDPEAFSLWSSSSSTRKRAPPACAGRAT